MFKCARPKLIDISDFNDKSHSEPFQAICECRQNLKHICQLIKTTEKTPKIFTVNSQILLKYNKIIWNPPRRLRCFPLREINIEVIDT